MGFAIELKSLQKTPLSVSTRSNMTELSAYIEDYG